MEGGAPFFGEGVGVDKGVENHADGTAGEFEFAFGFEFPGALEGDGLDGDAGFEGDVEAAFGEGSEGVGAAAGAFGEDDHALALLEGLDGFADLGDLFAFILAVEEDAAHEGHPAVHEGEAGEFFFGDEGEGSAGVAGEEGDIEIALMVGDDEEDVAGGGVAVVDAFEFGTGEAAHPFAPGAGDGVDAGAGPLGAFSACLPLKPGQCGQNGELMQPETCKKE